MRRSIAVILFAVSCVSAFPVLFLTYKDGEGSKGQPRLLDCVSPIPFLDTESYGLSYRCRPSTQTPESLSLKSSNLPIFEILEEPENDISALEVDEISVPAKFPLFQSSRIVVQNNDAANANTKYEVISEGRFKKNQGGCDDDEVFVAELDLCMPYTPVQSPLKTASVNDDQKASAVTPTHTITKVGYAKDECPDGEMWLPSVSICAPIDNCWPCDDEDKSEDKNKGKTQRTGAEDDD